MNNIYIVTSGEYSDYSIDMVFATEKLATEYIQCKSYADQFYDGRIEEYDINNSIPEKYYKNEYYMVGKMRRKKNNELYWFNKFITVNHLEKENILFSTKSIFGNIEYTFITKLSNPKKRRKSWIISQTSRKNIL
jgi:hypothetical protein